MTQPGIFGGDSAGFGGFTGRFNGQDTGEFSADMGAAGGGQQNGGAAQTSGNDERLEKAKEIPAAELLSWVRQQLGKPYEFGADGPGSYDCSGLVMRAYGRFGYKMPHKSADQASFGRPVGKASAMPGDLIFFNLGRGRNSHVGIMTGKNTFIEAPRTGRPVRETTINDYYRARITSVRRIPEVVQGAGSGTATGTGAARTFNTNGASARPARPGQPSPTPSPSGSLGTGSAAPGAGGALMPSGTTDGDGGFIDGVVDGVTNALSDPFGAIAEAIKAGLSPLTAISWIADKVFSAFMPTMLIRVACGVTGTVCIVIGLIMIASDK